jgi:hypothetical protein
MAHTTTPVTTTPLPAVGILAMDLPADGPSILIREMPYGGDYIVAYDRNTWTRDLVEGYVHMYVGDYDLVEPPKAGA